LLITWAGCGKTDKQVAAPPGEAQRPAPTMTPATPIPPEETATVAKPATPKEPAASSSPATPQATESPESPVETPPAIATPRAAETPAPAAGNAPPSTLSPPDISSMEAAIQEQLAEQRAEVQSKPNDAEAVGTLAMLYHGYGFLPDAQVAYERAIELSPATFRWNYLLGHVLLQQEKLDDAIKLFEKSIALEPDYTPARVSLANAHLRAGDAEATLEIAGPLHEAYPDDEMIAYTLGMAHLAADQPVWGVQYLKPVLDAHPHMGGVRIALANCFLKLGQKERAASLTEGRKPNHVVPTLRDPELVSIFRLLTGSVAEQRKGLANLAAGNFDTALEHFEKALSFDPHNQVALMGQSDALINLREYERGEKILKEALERNENEHDLPVLIRLAHLYLAQERYDEAEPLVNRALALAGDNTTALALKTRLAMGQQDYHNVVAGMERIVAIAPEDANAHFELATAYLLVQRLPAAEKALLRAVELDPAHGPAAEALAEVYLARGESGAATTWFRRAFDAGVRSPRATLHVATYAMRNQQYDFAIRTLKEGLERHPGDPDMADTLARMYALCPDARYRDWEAAYQIVTEIYGTDDEAMSIRGLNTSAAVHAEAGNFEQAIHLTKESIRRAKLEENAEQLRVVTHNLKQYENGRRLYEPPVE
jgi:tetratricopeptide (TPR) repeat protein